MVNGPPVWTLLFEGAGVTVLDEAGAVLDAVVVITDEVALVVWLAFVVAAVAEVAAAVAFAVVFVDVDGESTKTAMPLTLVSKSALVEFILASRT